MVEEYTARLCGDSSPHLKREGDDFITCTLPCVESVGHRPETPHRCVEGHEWLIDAQDFIAGS